MKARRWWWFIPVKPPPWRVTSFPFAATWASACSARFIMGMILQVSLWQDGILVGGRNVLKKLTTSIFSIQLAAKLQEVVIQASISSSSFWCSDVHSGGERSCPQIFKSEYWWVGKWTWWRSEAEDACKCDTDLLAWDTESSSPSSMVGIKW